MKIVGIFRHTMGMVMDVAHGRRRVVKPRFWAILLMLTACVMAYVFTSQDQYIARQQGLIEQLKGERASVQLANSELERKIAFTGTDEYIERVARDELGLLKENEIRFVTNAE